MSRSREIAALAERVDALRGERRRRHRRANWLFLLAGGGFGSAVYLARTRFAQLWRGGEITGWIVIVGVAVAVFAVAAWFHGRATDVDEEIAGLRRRIAELADEEAASAATTTRGPGGDAPR